MWRHEQHVVTFTALWNDDPHPMPREGGELCGLMFEGFHRAVVTWEIARHRQDDWKLARIEVSGSLGPSFTFGHVVAYDATRETCAGFDGAIPHGVDELPIWVRGLVALSSPMERAV